MRYLTAPRRGAAEFAAMRGTRGTRWLAPLLVAWGPAGCQNPSACEEPCDSARVAQRIAGADAIDCGVATGDGEAPAVHACIGSAFAAGSRFFGLVEIPTTAPDGAILVRGFARGGDGRLREVLGTRQPDRAIVQTRICFSAIVESDEAGARLRCTEPMDGLFVECQCLQGRSADAGQP